MKKISLMFFLCLSIMTTKGVNLSALLATECLEKELVEIIETNDLVKLQTYVDYGYDVNQAFTDERTKLRLLHIVAVFPGDREAMVRFLLLDRQARVDVCDATESTPLHCACDTGNPGCVRELLKARADVNKPTGEGETPLHIAAKKGIYSVVALLLGQTNIQIEQVESTYGATALHIACLFGHEAIVRLLVEKGAQVNARNGDLATPLFLACQQGHVNIVRFLHEQGGSLDARLKDGATPLHVAASEGHLEVIKYLVSKGASFKTKKTTGTTPFYAAAQNGRQDVVNFFIRNGYDVNEKNDVTGLSALHIASLMGKLGVVTLLLKQPEINRDASAEFITSMVNQSGERVPVKFVLQIDGIVLDPAKDNGFTPLHLACIWGQEAIVKELVTKGANISLKTSSGKSALEFAGEKGHTTISTFLKAAETRCAICFKVGENQRCAQCKEVFYCTRECQGKHWPIHKVTCIKK